MFHTTCSKRRSIARNLTLSLAITLTAVAVIVLYMSFLISSRQAEKELHEKEDEYLLALTEVLKNSLWNFNEKGVWMIGNAYTENEFIAALRIEGSDGVVLFNLEKPGEKIGFSKKNDIVHHNEFIGRVFLSLSSRRHSAENRRFFLYYGIQRMAGFIGKTLFALENHL